MLATPAMADAPPLQIPTVVHAHSTWSTGDQSLEQLVSLAKARGVRAVILTENLLQQFEYGLPPLRSFLRHRVEYPSLLQKSPRKFLAAVRQANARQPDVLFIPGAETLPYYYWTGSLLGGTLTMHDGQKNILVVGLQRPEDYQRLPVIGNPGAARWGWQSPVLLLLPVLLLSLGAWLFTHRRQRVVHFQRFRVVQRRRRVIPAFACSAAGIFFFLNNYPFQVQALSPYNASQGVRPHQSVIDYVAQHGGLTVWSLPEARDYQVVQVAGLKATIRTEPYAEDLLRTEGFTAFGGVYEDTTTFTNPGGGWDHLLLEYLAGRRKTPAWALGEAAYHREGQAGKRFGEVQTVILERRKDATSLLEAFKAGRMYALRRTGEAGLALDQFQVSASGEAAAEAGGRLTARRGSLPLVRAVVRATTSAPMQVEVRLMRSGATVHSVKGETPLTITWQDAALQPSGRTYYRLEVQGPGGHQILSNPIFVTMDK
ncbi:MAG: hypothetical protein HY712_01105 [candidate division NC10 bacterium]|nr:hypothetical protein [candidate division NC10 bacterium]